MSAPAEIAASAAAAIRQAERERIAAIFAKAAETGFEQVAWTLAFTTDTTVEDAANVLAHLAATHPPQMSQARIAALMEERLHAIIQ